MSQVTCIIMNNHKGDETGLMLDLDSNGRAIRIQTGYGDDSTTATFRMSLQDCRNLARHLVEVSKCDTCEWNGGEYALHCHKCDTCMPMKKTFYALCEDCDE